MQLAARGKDARWLAVFFGLALAPTAQACEPIVPLVRLFFGTNTVGSSTFVGQSAIALGVAVAVKTLLFVRFEDRLPGWTAAGAMVVANVFSTLIGIALAMAAAVPVLMLPFTFGVFLVSLRPASRLVEFNPWESSRGLVSRLGTFGIAILVAVLYFATFLLFGAAAAILEVQTGAGVRGGGVPYWGMKLVYIYVGLFVSLFLTTAWEESVVAKVAGKTVPVGNEGGTYFLPSVLRANIYTLLLVSLVAAVEVLPRRLASPDFLIGKLAALIGG